jgi:hypothetical protein
MAPDSQEGHIREVAGDSDSVTFEIVDEREPLFETQLVSDADIRYLEEWEDNKSGLDFPGVDTPNRKPREKDKDLGFSIHDL